MADYIVHFKVYLRQASLPEGWTNPIVHDCYIRAEDFPNFKKLSNQEMTQFIRQQGIIVLKPSTKAMQDDIPTMDLMRFIPMQMIAYIDRETEIIVGAMPDKRDEGVIYQ
jgi:hypothetical protein